MQSQVSNGWIRELVAERDYLKQRNIQLSESLDATGSQYRMILARLGFDAEGNPLPKEPSDAAPAPTGDPDAADGAPADEMASPRKK